VAPGQVISITVNASGGYAPYKLVTVTDYGRFSSSQTIAGSFTNTTSVNRVVEKLFGVIDNAGNEGTCFFKVTVLPAGSQPNQVNNGCSLTANPTAPQINQAFTLTVTPSIAGNFTLKSLQLQNDWVLNPNMVASAPIAYSVKYTTTGARTLAAIIERAGVQYSCSLSVNVGDGAVIPTGPTVQINVSPALKLPVGSTFTLSNVLSNFAASPAPSFQVASNDQTIVVTPSGTNHLITGNGTARTFTVTVTASQGTGATAVVASASIELEFTANNPVITPVCSIVAPSGILTIGQELVFPMQVLNAPSDIVIFNAVDAGLNSQVLSGTVAPARIKFSTPGVRTIRVLGARSAMTSALCNATGELTMVVNVVSTLNSCSAQFSPTVSIAGTVIKASALIPAGSGDGPFETTMASNSPLFSVIKVTGPREAMVRFRKPGSYPITMTVKDLSNGSTVSCQTVHQAVPADTFVAAEDEPGNLVRIFKGPMAQPILAPAGFAPFADVMPNFRGGNRVATADITGDGIVDIIVAAGYNGGLRIRAFDGTNLMRIRDFVAFSGISTGMTRTYLAAGDIDADGFAEIVVGSGCNANAPRVEIYSGRTGSLMTRYQVAGITGGVRVAVGDVNGDGYSDVVTSACSCTQINAFSGKAFADQLPASPFINFLSYPGVNTDTKVAVGDVNGDGFADIITGTNGSRATQNKIFSGNPAHNLMSLYSLVPFNGTYGTNYVGAGDVNGDGLTDIIVAGDGDKQTQEVKVFNSNGYSEIIGPTGAFRLLPFGNACEKMYVAGGAGAL